MQSLEGYVLTLIPVEGQANLYVNPAILPKENIHFYYSATQEVTKRVIINESDLKNMGLNQTVSARNAGHLREGALRARVSVHTEGRQAVRRHTDHRARVFGERHYRRSRDQKAPAGVQDIRRRAH